MSTKNHRKRLLMGAVPVAAVLAAASVGYACTIFKGSMTVTGNGNDPLTGAPSSVTVTGNNSGMSYCNSASPEGSAPALGAGYTFAPRNGGTIDVSVAPSTDSCASQLPDGVYDVNFVNGPAHSDTNGIRPWLLDCMFGNNPPNVNLGTMTVTGGSGSGTYSLPNNLLPNHWVHGDASASVNDTSVDQTVRVGDESAVCVSNQPPQRGLYGLQAPITIL